MTQDYDDTDAMLNEMMARGAAEQRLKDAERQEPVAWQKQHLNGTWSWTACHEAYEANGVPTRGLYTHPANVAALEARVKELEVENEKFRNAMSKIASHVGGFASPNCSVDFMTSAIPEEVRLSFAALNREGVV